MRLQSNIIVLSLALLAQTGHATTTTATSTLTTASQSTTASSDTASITSATATGETEIPLYALPQWTTADTCARSCARAIKYAYLTLLDCPTRNPASCLCVGGPEATMAERASSCVLASCTTSTSADAVSASGLIADYCSSNYATASITSATGSSQSAGASSQATATGSSQATGTAASDTGSSKSEGLSGGAIAGIVVALVALGLGVGTAATWLLFRRRAKKSAATTKASDPDPAPAYELYEALEKPPTNEGLQVVVETEPPQEAHELPADWSRAELPAEQ